MTRASMHHVLPWLLLISITTDANRQIRHPPDDAVAIFALAVEAAPSKPGPSGCRAYLQVFGLVVGCQYVLDFTLGDLGTRLVGVAIAPGDKSFLQRIYLPAGAQGELKISARVYDSFPGLDDDDAFLSAINHKFTVPDKVVCAEALLHEQASDPAHDQEVENTRDSTSVFLSSAGGSSKVHHDSGQGKSHRIHTHNDARCGTVISTAHGILNRALVLCIYQDHQAQTGKGGVFNTCSREQILMLLEDVPAKDDIALPPSVKVKMLDYVKSVLFNFMESHGDSVSSKF